MMDSPYQHQHETQLSSQNASRLSSIEFLSQELFLSQEKVSQYTRLISRLYAELETIRSIVCKHCSERISTPGDNTSRSQANLLNVSSTSTTLSHSRVDILIPSGSPEPPRPPLQTSPAQVIEAAAVIAKPTNEKLQNHNRSVTHNSGIEKDLDITFVNAFRPALEVNVVRFSPDGNLLAAGLTNNLGKIIIYDMRTMLTKCVLAEYTSKHDKISSQSRHIRCVCFSPDSRYVVSGASDAGIYIWDVDRIRVRAVLKGHRKDVRSLDVSPNNKLLVTGAYDRSVRVWKIRDGSSRVISTTGKFTSVRFSPNGQYIAASNTDQFLRIWHVRSEKMVGEWNVNQSIRSMAISPDGGKLVTGSIVGVVKSWDISSLQVPGLQVEGSIGQAGMCGLTFDGHAGEVRSASISPDSKWLVTGSSDHRVRLWNMHSAVRHYTLNCHADELWSVDFSPLGNYIATGSKDGSVTLWKYQKVR